ncbi:MAG: hypothetical protein JOZ99_04190 [Actinobacteria bacterium]|nr:hypothetical protein [Actinomycetota bacterium]
MPSEDLRSHRTGLVAGAALAAAAAAVVGWQTRRVAPLWDLSYVVNTATRIAHGDVPYRDFGMLHAPGTFVVQAVLIRVFGAHYWINVVAYTMVVSGASVALTFAIVRMLLRGVFDDAIGLWVSVALCLPLVFLSTHAILPVPFYDGDVGLAVLVGLCCALATRRHAYLPVWCWALGPLLVAPILFKQNVGIAFFVLMHLALAVSALRERGDAMRGYRLILLSSLAAIAAVACVLQLAVGLHAYVHWTVSVAGSRRLTTVTGPFAFGPYATWFEAFALAAGIGGTALLARGRNAVVRVAGVAAFVSPLVVVVSGYTRTAELLRVWPMTLVLGVAAGLVLTLRGRPVFEALLPIVMMGTVFAAFLSQGYVGSSYGVWPLLVIDGAVVAWAVREVVDSRTEVLAACAAGLGAVLLVVPAFHYVSTNSRLYYIRDATSGPLARSRTGSLRGLSNRGPFVPNMDAVVAYVKTHIPARDPMIVFPGEDPVYYALDRRPLFPVVTFDTTANAYSTAELRRLTVDRRVKWMLVQSPSTMQFISGSDRKWDEWLAAMQGVQRACDGAPRCSFQPVANVGGYTVMELRAARVG